MREIKRESSERERERESRRWGKVEREADFSLNRETDAGLDPGTLGS